MQAWVGQETRRYEVKAWQGGTQSCWAGGDALAHHHHVALAQFDRPREEAGAGAHEPTARERTDSEIVDQESSVASVELDISGLVSA